MCIIDAEKIKRELDLEEEAINIGIKKYQEDKAKQEISELPPGRKLIQIAMTSMIQALEEFKSPKAGGGGRLVDTRKYLKSVSNEILAFITVKKLINCLYEPIKVQKAAIQLSQMIIDHMEYEEFKKDSPGYYRMLNDKVFPHTTTYYNKKNIIARARKKANLEHIVWPEEDRLHMGIKLIDLYIESTGLIERVRHPDDDLYYLHGTEKVKDWIEKQHARCELLDPLYMPMVVPPKPWDTPFGGGYLSNYATMKFKLIKSDSKQALEALLDKDLSNVYRAVNAVQEVPWRINQKLYIIMKEAWESGTCLGGLPRQDEEPLPSKPWNNDDEYEAYKSDDPQVIRKWKNEATTIYLKRVGTRSKRISMTQKLWIAEKFLNDEEIYFVWTLDWRGRMYPVSTFIHPQGDDTGKALLEFANGKPLGERGAWWLAVHLANEYGYDKCSFEDRVKWTHDHHEQILDSARNPLDGNRFWVDADHPWRFLAACLEWEGYDKEGPEHICHQPINLDGTCNGLQNFSAMLLDEVGGSKVNLVPQSKPADVYQAVADKCSEKISKLAAKGDDMAKIWIGKVDRKVAKRNVMTTPYGAKLYGMKEQLVEEINERDEKLGYRYLGDDIEGDNFKACTFLANIMTDAIGETVIAAKKAMGWLQQVATISSKANIPIEWTTPIGFIPFQEYQTQELTRVSTFWGGVRVRLGLVKNTGKLDRRKQASGISPNFVHSCDASHLMMTVLRCLDKGVTDFSLIHDSYGTHACDVDILAQELREAFIQQYTEHDVLNEFREAIIQKLPPDLAEEIPPVPNKGKLDLNAVRDSLYFFA